MSVKHIQSRLRLRKHVLLALALVLVLSVAVTATLAQPIEPADATGRINDSILEFGVWWVEDYPPAGAGGSDLPATRPDALGLRDKLTSTCKYSLFGVCLINWSTPRWTARFVYGNANAWAKDWRRSQNGGTENSYIDTVDLAYFAGHGSKSGIIFGANSPTPRTVTKNDALNAWGDRDLDWIGLAACNVLDDPLSNLQEWGQAMNGVRLIMGFKTVMNDVPHGREFGQYIRDGYSMTQAWFKAADKLQSQGRVARVLAEQQAYFDDTWARHNASTTVNWPKYYRTHTVGSEPARFVDASQIGGQMPVLQVQPIPLAERESYVSGIGDAFGVDISIPGEGLQAAAFRRMLQDGGVIPSQDGQLEVDSEYGLFLHADMANLWKTESELALMAASGMAMESISEERARAIADSFLRQHNLLPGDAQFYEVGEDTLTTMDEVMTAQGLSEISITDQLRTNYQVIYSRIITYELRSRNADALNTAVEFSVMGPGSKLKIYVATEVPAGLTAASLQQQSILGGMGGYRNIQTPAQAAAVGALQMVDVLPYGVINKLWEHMEAQVSLDVTPLAPTEIKSREIVTHTLAYWEGAMGFSQGELIPVYALTVRNTMDGGDEPDYDVESVAYIPVDPEYMAPLAQISTTVNPETPLTPGQVLSFEALDASMTLAELGLDPDPAQHPLNFNLGTQDGLFTYDWYLNEVSEETHLGSGRTLEYTVNLGAGVDIKDNVSGTQRIILVVTDVEKGSEPKTSQAVFTMTATPPLYLPSLLRGQ